MITILHGDDEVAIHKELSRILQEQASRGVQISRLDAKGLSLPVLESTLGTQELFAPEKILIVDRLHGLPKSKAKDELIDLVSKYGEGETHVVLVENKVVTPTMLKKFPNARVVVLKLPVLLFSFVDSLGIQASTRLITAFHQIIETQDAEFVFAMLVRQIRMLLSYVSDGSYSGSPFGRNKIVTQSSHFRLDTLLRLHKSLLAIDLGQKTSRSPLSLTQEIDLWLAKI